MDGVWDTTAEARRFARLHEEGDGLWKVGTVGIIRMRGELSKHVGGRTSCKHAAIPYGRNLNLEVIKDSRRLLIMSSAGKMNNFPPYGYPNRMFIAFRASCKTRSEIHKDEFARLSNK